MGVVYKARQVGLSRFVALKVILGGSYAAPEQLTRFRIEAQAIARLQHPSIVQIHDIGEHQGVPYFSLEYVEGGSLDKSLCGIPQPGRHAAQVVEALARAVQAAHDVGIVHRDLKPSNVLLAKDGSHKITDFGLAKQLDGGTGQTASGAILGTPSYMAPEQAEGKKHLVGPAVDVYALGAILYEMLVGRPPFRGATSLDTILQVLSDDPVPPGRLVRSSARDLETICLKCLEKKPERRYLSAAALAEDLRRYLNGQPIRARRPSLLALTGYWLRRPERMRDAGVLMIFAAVLTAAALIRHVTGHTVLQIADAGLTNARRFVPSWLYFFRPGVPLAASLMAALIGMQLWIGLLTWRRRLWAIRAGFALVLLRLIVSAMGVGLGLEPVFIDSQLLQGDPFIGAIVILIIALSDKTLYFVILSLAYIVAWYAYHCNREAQVNRAGIGVIGDAQRIRAEPVAPADRPRE